MNFSARRWMGSSHCRKRYCRGYPNYGFGSDLVFLFNATSPTIALLLASITL